MGVGRAGLALVAGLLVLGDLSWAAQPRAEDLRECLRSPHGAVVILRCTAVLSIKDLGQAERRRALQRRGIAYHNDGRIDLAIVDFGAAIELAPDDPVLYGLRGNARMRDRDYAGAVDDYGRAIERAPDQAVTYALRGNARRLAGDYAGAISDFDQAIAQQPQLLEAWLNRGSTYRAMERYPEALADFDKAANLDFRDGRPIAAAARVRFFQGDFAAAAERFTAALNRQPTDVFNIGWRYFAAARAGRDGRRELQAHASRLDRSRWPGPLLALLLEERLFADIERAATDRDPREQLERLTDLYFFEGQRLLIAGRPAEARRMFERVLATGDRAPVSAIGAAIELKRLP
ncbi:MAG: tetratricopeptide repeat protein [Alphaproteobacteria bacterium]|nr:tetratricopeptide repeat protein [Alphaproteobacteria bacterium]